MQASIKQNKSNQINIVLNDYESRQLDQESRLPNLAFANSFLKIDQHFSKFIGLEPLKENIKQIYAMHLINEERKKLSLNCSHQVLHMMFKGNPGTGKTTFARSLAHLYYEMKILSKGHMIEVDRADLVGEYIGQTAQKTRKLLKKAIGGILFIDEAYSLARGGEKDFGREAIDTLVKYMEDYQKDLVIIMAGYPYEMNYFLRLNPGLKSRFPFIIDFPDYTTGELMDIAKQMTKKRDYLLSKTAKRLLKLHLQERESLNVYNFSNARYIRNLIERAIRSQAMRLMGQKNLQEQQLMLLTKEDFNFLRKSTL